jgi:hypothetical protein
MNEGRSNTILLTVIGIATLLVVLVGATFAFFTARLTDGNSTSTVTFQAASTGTLTFNGGETITMQNIYPRGARTADTNGNTTMGADPADKVWVTKGFYVTYRNTSDTYDYEYQLKLNYNTNFGTEQLHYVFSQAAGHCAGNNKSVTQATCTGDNVTWTGNTTGVDNVGAIAQKTGWLNPVSTTTAIVLGKGTFYKVAENASATDVTHNYSLTVSYPDSGENQNYTGQTAGETNQNKSLTAFITIEEVNATHPYEG